jgi:pyruvate dehydrogenase E1 component beta subunit
MVDLSLQTAEELRGERINLEVIDTPTLEPMDMETILTSVEKTERVVVAEDVVRCDVPSEILM